MRRLIMLGVAAVALTGCGNTAPAAVVNEFERLYPEVESVNWTNQPYGYEAVFTDDNNIDYEAEFSQRGIWMETEYELSAAAFPPFVLERIRQDTGNAAIEKYEIEITPEGMFFEVETWSGEYYYDIQGQPATNANEDA